MSFLASAVTVFLFADRYDYKRMNFHIYFIGLTGMYTSVNKSSWGTRSGRVMVEISLLKVKYSCSLSGIPLTPANRISLFHAKIKAPVFTKGTTVAIGSEMLACRHRHSATLTNIYRCCIHGFCHKLMNIKIY